MCLFWQPKYSRNYVAEGVLIFIPFQVQLNVLLCFPRGAEELLQDGGGRRDGGHLLQALSQGASGQPEGSSLHSWNSGLEVEPDGHCHLLHLER